MFTRQKKEVLSNLQARYSGKDLHTANKKALKKDLSSLFDMLASLHEWLKGLAPIYRQTAQAAGDYAIHLVVDSASFDVTAANVEKYFTERAGTIAKGIDEETDKQLRATLMEGINNGESIAQLSDRIENLFSAISGYRAERIARSESVDASSYASQQAWLQTDLVDENEWMVDGNPCPICESNDGMQVKIGDAFFSGDDAPPAHPSCECTLLPVIAGVSYTAPNFSDVTDEALAEE